MTDNPQTIAHPPPPQPPEYHFPPPPPGDPPLTAQPTELEASQATSQPTAASGQYAPPPGPPPVAAAPTVPSANLAPVEPNTDPFSDDQQTTAAAQLQPPPQHPDRPPATGSLTETPLHSEPAPILPPRPQPEATPPPPRASFDQIPDHPAMRQSSLGRAQSPSHSVQRVPVTPVQPQPVPPAPQAPVLDANAGNLESDPAIVSLHAMFPAFDLLVIQSVLEASGNDKDAAIDNLLSMGDPDYVPAQAQTTGGGAPPQGRPQTQTELDEEFARRLMLEEEQQAQAASWPPREEGYSHANNVPYQTYQPRRSGEYQRPTGGNPGGIGDMANDLQQQFRSFISGARGPATQNQPQGQAGQGGSGAGYQDQFNRIADTGKKTFNSIFNKVKQKMEEFDRQHPPDTQNMNQPPQSGHWSNWQGPSTAQHPQQQPATYAQSPAPSQPFPAAQSPPPAASHGTLNSNPYGIPPTDTQPSANTAALPASSGRWQYEPEPATTAPAQPQAPATGTGAAEEPRKSIDTSRLGLLPKRPVSLMDVNANTRPAPAPAPTHTNERDSDEESLEYVDRPIPGGMSRP